MTLQHPLDKLSAVVDGELDHDSRDKVLSHLVGCESCRGEVDAQRRLKARLAAARSGAFQRPDAATAGRAVVLDRAARRGATGGDAGVSLFPQRSAFPAARTGATRPGDPGPRAPAGVPAYWVRPVAAAVASLLGTAFVLGDPARTEQPPVLQPPVASFSADHAATTDGTPFADPVAMLNSFNGAGYAGLSPTLQPVALRGTLSSEPLPARRPGQHRTDRLRPAHARSSRRTA